MKIYSLTDKIPVKIGDITISISPLSTIQKAEIQGLMLKTVKDPENTLPAMQASNLCVKYSLKEIKGVEMADGTSFGLQFEDGVLTDDCVEQLNNSELGTLLHQTCLNLLKGIPNTFVDEYGNELKGVEMVRPKSKKKAKK